MVTKLKITRIACAGVPLAGFMIASRFNKPWINYAVVLSTVIVVDLLFIMEKKYSPESNVFKNRVALIGIFGLALFFYLQ